MSNPDPNPETRFKPGESGNKDGRPKGAKTKFRLKTAMEVFEETGFNPIAALVEFAINGDTADRRHRATSELARYYAPQLKSTEITIADGTQESAIKTLDKGPNPLNDALKNVPRETIKEDIKKYG